MGCIRGCMDASLYIPARNRAPDRVRLVVGVRPRACNGRTVAANLIFCVQARSRVPTLWTENEVYSADFRSSAI